RASEREALGRAHVQSLHAAPEAAAAHARERDTVTVARVHVRLDFENERGEAPLGRRQGPALRRSRRWYRRHVDESVEEGLHAGVGDGGAEEGGRQLATQERVARVRPADALDERHLLLELRVRARADAGGERWVVERTPHGVGATRTALRALEAKQLPRQ